MPLHRPAPVHSLPSGCREVAHVRLLEPGTALAVNLLALVPMAAGVVVMALWWDLVLRLRGTLPGGPVIPWWLGVVAAALLILPLHEWVHGQAIRWAGHRPRYGLMLGKGALYATADNALFPRNVFIVIALAPLAVITLLGMALVLALPDSVGFYTALAVIFNAGSAIGDLWMAALVWRRPPSALVRDEADSIRIYGFETEPDSSPAGGK